MNTVMMTMLVGKYAEQRQSVLRPLWAHDRKCLQSSIEMSLPTSFPGSKVGLLSLLRLFTSLFISLFTRPEREENVKADIFAGYRALLNRTKPTAHQAAEGDAMEVTDRSAPVWLLWLLLGFPIAAGTCGGLGGYEACDIYNWHNYN